jgi:argonaute-like protein implicated in RNA metabolism and viral defense
MNVPTSRLPDKDMQGAHKALIRAAARARELARQTGTRIVTIRDGKLVREIPGPEVETLEVKTDVQPTT